jgi:iron complex outermembrane recepter protein
VNLKGGRVPLTPDMTLRISGDYSFKLANDAGLVPGANINYSSDYSTNDVNYDFGRQEAFTKIDLTLTYREPKGTWSVQAFGNNITDEETLTRTVRFGQNVVAQTFAAPATYGVRFSSGF